jgi:hypothetical protein
MKKILFWGVVGLTVAVYSTMLGWSLPTISRAAGGQLPFDMRPGGYSLADVRGFLASLTPAGADFYRTVQHTLDIFYPPMLALAVAISIGALLPVRFKWWKWIVATPAMLTFPLDYLENAFVERMLALGRSGVTEELVGWASQVTVLKSQATTVAMSILLVLLVARGIGLSQAKLRERGGSEARAS